MASISWLGGNVKNKNSQMCGNISYRINHLRSKYQFIAQMGKSEYHQQKSTLTKKQFTFHLGTKKFKGCHRDLKSLIYASQQERILKTLDMTVSSIWRKEKYSQEKTRDIFAVLLIISGNEKGESGKWMNNVKQVNRRDHSHFLSPILWRRGEQLGLPTTN